MKEGNAHKELEKLHIQSIEALHAKVDQIDKEVNSAQQMGFFFPNATKNNITYITYVHSQSVLKIEFSDIKFNSML
jgi:hypothetical protein